MTEEERLWLAEVADLLAMQGGRRLFTFSSNLLAPRALVTGGFLQQQ
jgi:hypothetical protein